MSTILITGASGFLGKRLAQRLAKTGSNLYLTARYERSDQYIYKMDLTNQQEVFDTIKRVKPWLVYHIGAAVNLSRDQQTANGCLDVNICGTFNLLSALRLQVPKLLIFASTEEVYGNNPVPFQENQPPRPPSMYAVTKVSGEDMCSLFALETNCPVRIVRLATLYGPGNPLKRYIPQSIIKALLNEVIPVNSGSKRRDYLYIDDAVDILYKLQSYNLARKHILVNAGGGISYTLLDLLNKIVKIAGSKSKLDIRAFPDRANEAEEWLMDNTYARELLGWSPRVCVDDGLRHTVDFFKTSVL